jgi:hypothetical protein
MAKTTTFAEKAAKATMERGIKCPKCHTVLTPILLVTSERSAHHGGWRFSHRRVQVCKCNEKKIYE